jgi:hypothetical protein
MIPMNTDIQQLWHILKLMDSQNTISIQNISKEEIIRFSLPLQPYLHTIYQSLHFGTVTVQPVALFFR